MVRGARPSQEGWHQYQEGVKQRRRLLYDENGKLRLANVGTFFWQQVGKPVKVLGGVLLLLYGYTQLVIYIEHGNRRQGLETQRERVEFLYETGKVRSSKHIGVPTRVSDDPDMFRYPAHNQTGGWKSKNMYDDAPAK
jgi:hypothetical protein